MCNGCLMLEGKSMSDKKVMNMSAMECDRERLFFTQCDPTRAPAYFGLILAVSRGCYPGGTVVRAVNSAAGTL